MFTIQDNDHVIVKTNNYRQAVALATQLSTGTHIRITEPFGQIVTHVYNRKQWETREK